MTKTFHAFAAFILLFSGLSLTVYGQSYTIQQYLNIRSANSPSFSPDGRNIAYLTNASGTFQVWTMALPSGMPHQLTNYDDNVGFVRWLGDDSGIIFGKAKGGDENTQFYWMKTDGTGVKALTDEPGVRHDFGKVSEDGKFIAYASNKRDRNFFDIYTMDLATGKEQAITLTGGTALSKDEIDRMVKDAEAFAAEDHKRREAAEARNGADQLVYTVDKSLGEWGDKVPETDRAELTTVTDALKETLKDQDADAEKLNAASEAVMTVFSRIGQAMYEHAQASEAAPTAGPAGDDASSNDDEVVEGEIVEEGGAQ